jgi:hypothetical protein
MPKATRSFAPQERINLLLRQARESRGVGDQIILKASWLVSGKLGSEIWETSSPGINTLTTIHFDRVLSDGSLLTDPSNALLLQAIQTWAFHLRMGTVVDSQFAPERWKNLIYYSINLSSWVVFHRNIFFPETHGFRLVTLDGIKTLLTELCEGGWTKALYTKERIVDFFHEVTSQDTPVEGLIESLDCLPDHFVKAAIKWLRENKGYTYRSKAAHSVGGVSRTFMESTFGISKLGMPDDLRAFLRQFEPMLDAHLLTPTYNSKRHPSQNTPGLGKAGREGLKEGHLLDYITFCSYFFAPHALTLDLIPSLDIDRKTIVTDLRFQIERGSHTKLIPLTIGLHAINQAAKWVIVYSEIIVDAAIFYAEEFEYIHANTILAHQWEKKLKFFRATCSKWTYIDPYSKETMSLCAELNIDRPIFKCNSAINADMTDLRSVIEGLIGACAVLIAILKPIRNKELCNLKRDCMLLNPLFGGAFLEHLQGKSGVMGLNLEIARDIPSIAARGIQYLQVLGTRLSAIYGDNSEHAKDLFYFPGRGLKKPSGKSNSARVNHCINTFCDLIDIPIDNTGRRWYLRVHEMRKFFLLITNRHQGALVTEALRHAAGHVDPSHIDAYIAPDDYDDEYIRFESECVEDKLIALDMGMIDRENNEGLASLYNLCCNHFGVHSLSSVSANDAHSFLIDLRHSQAYEISTYAISSVNYDGEVLEIDFAIRIGDKKDEKFDN